MDLNSDALSLGDRALHYGHGAFETIALLQGRPLFFEAHMARLSWAIERLHLGGDPQRLIAQIRSACHAITETGLFKVIVTAGEGPRGYASPSVSLAKPRLLTFWYPQPLNHALYRAPSALYLCQTGLADQPLLAGLKHLNRLEQVVATDEWQQVRERYPEHNIEGGLMAACRCEADAQARLIETTTANLFLIEFDGVTPLLITPSLLNAGVEGVVRRFVMEVAHGFGWRVEEAVVTLSRLSQANGCFITGTGVGIQRINALYEEGVDASLQLIADWGTLWRASERSEPVVVPNLDYTELSQDDSASEAVVYQLWVALQYQMRALDAVTL